MQKRQCQSKKFLNFRNSTIFLDKKLLLLLSWSILLLVASTGRTNFDWLLQLSDYSQLFDHNSTEWLVKNKAAIAQIPCEILIMQFIGKLLCTKTNAI